MVQVWTGDQCDEGGVPESCREGQGEAGSHRRLLGANGQASSMGVLLSSVNKWCFRCLRNAQGKTDAWTGSAHLVHKETYSKVWKGKKNKWTSKGMGSTNSWFHVDFPSMWQSLGFLHNLCVDSQALPKKAWTSSFLIIS